MANDTKDRHVLAAAVHEKLNLIITFNLRDFKAKDLKKWMPEDALFRIMHHSSKSNICLQIIDYCCWAIVRNWERDVSESYELVEEGLQSEFEIFKTGTD